MAKNRYFRTATVSLFAGVGLVGLTLLANPEAARRFHLLAIGQKPAPFISKTVADDSGNQITVSKVTIPENSTGLSSLVDTSKVEEISISEPALLLHSEEAPLELADEKEWENEIEFNDETQPRPVKLDVPQLSEPQREPLLVEKEDIIVEVDTTDLDERLLHLDQQINRLEDVENKQREILSRSEDLFVNIDNLDLDDSEPIDEELIEEIEEDDADLLDPVGMEDSDDGPILKADLETGLEVEQEIIQEKPVLETTGLETTELDTESQLESTDPVLIARKDETDASKIYLKFENAKYKEVFRLLAKVSRATILISPELKGNLTEEYRVHDLEEFLSIMLPPLGYSFQREEKKIYIMSAGTLRIISQNPALKDSEFIKLVNVQGINLQEEQEQGFIRKRNPRLQPPEYEGLYSLFDHSQSGDHKMGQSEIDPLTKELYSGKSILIDDTDTEWLHEKLVPQPNSGIIQAGFSQGKPPKTGKTHTPRLFQNTQPAKPILDNKVNQSNYQTRNRLRREPQKQYSSRPPIQAKPSEETKQQFIKRPVSLPVISVKPF